jgi:hypothetical protein
LVTRIFGFCRLVISLAIVGLAVVGLGSRVSATPSPPAGLGIGTALPPGWELCILAGVAAPVTQDNVANLDEWQVVEGGSTNNSAAYNPFNTRRMTDVNGTPLPAIMSSNGFPAFANWAAGCAATVATLLQPNMAPIVTALRAGNVAPPGLFLLDVDQSRWCAPSAGGTPCYVSEILLGLGTATGVQLESSGPLAGALAIYTDSSAALTAYDQDVATTAVEQGTVDIQTEQLAAAEDEVAASQRKLASAGASLRKLAVYDYTNNNAITSNSNLQEFGAPDGTQMLARYFGTLDTNAVVGTYERAQSDLQSAVFHRSAVAASLAQSTLLLASDQAAQHKALSRLDADLNTIQSAGVCAAVPSTPPPPTVLPAPSAQPAAPASPASGQGSAPSAQPPAPASPAPGQGSAPSAQPPAAGPAAPGQGSAPSAQPPATGSPAAQASGSGQGSAATLQACLVTLAPPNQQASG